jgi:hypothetical protein
MYEVLVFLEPVSWQLRQECKAVNTAIKSSLNVLKVKSTFNNLQYIMFPRLLKVKTTGYNQDRKKLHVRTPWKVELDTYITCR